MLKLCRFFAFGMRSTVPWNAQTTPWIISLHPSLFPLGSIQGKEPNVIAFTYRRRSRGSTWFSVFCFIYIICNPTWYHLRIKLSFIYWGGRLGTSALFGLNSLFYYLCRVLPSISRRVIALSQVNHVDELLMKNACPSPLQSMNFFLLQKEYTHLDGILVENIGKKGYTAICSKAVLKPRPG